MFDVASKLQRHFFNVICTVLAGGEKKKSEKAVRNPSIVIVCNYLCFLLWRILVVSSHTTAETSKRSKCRHWNSRARVGSPPHDEELQGVKVALGRARRGRSPDAKCCTLRHLILYFSACKADRLMDMGFEKQCREIVSMMLQKKEAQRRREAMER